MGVAGVIVSVLVAAGIGFAACALLSKARCNDCAAAQNLQNLTVEPAWERPTQDGNTCASKPEVLAFNRAVADVIAERQRQVHVEGWTAEHDDAWTTGELAQAAACYALFSDGRSTVQVQYAWPWDASWWKPKDRRRDLVRAGALILAEIERLDRTAAKACDPLQGVPS